jgi:hypothetical protein
MLDMWSAILSVFLGVFGWFATSFIAKPLLDCINLRNQVLEEMIFTANVNDEKMQVYGKSVESLRRLGAKVQATEVTATPLLRLCISKLGYNLSVAGSNLIGLSNSLNVPGRHIHADKVEKGLRLPLTSTAEFLSAVQEELRQPRR